MSTRPPVSDAPPAYAPTTRYYRGSLRGPLLLITAFSCIYSFGYGASLLRDRGSDNDSKINLMYLVTAVLMFSIGAIELCGFFAVYRGSIVLVKLYFPASAIAAIIVTAAELFRLVIHFTDKSGIVASCVTSVMADNDGSADDYTTAEAQSYCTSSWRNSTWWDIGLLIVSTLLGFFFASLTASYLHQLLNPQSMRTHQPQLAPSSQYNYPLPSYPPPPGGPPGGYAGQYSGGDYPGAPHEQFQAAPPYVGGGVDPTQKEKEEYQRWGEAGPPRDEEHNPFNEGDRLEGQRGYDVGSTDTVHLEPRRQTEGRI